MTTTLMVNHIKGFYLGVESLQDYCVISAEFSVPRNAADFMTFIRLGLFTPCLPCDSYSYANFHYMHSVSDSVFFRVQEDNIYISLNPLCFFVNEFTSCWSWKRLMALTITTGYFSFLKNFKFYFQRGFWFMRLKVFTALKKLIWVLWVVARVVWWMVAIVSVEPTASIRKCRQQVHLRITF